MQRIRLFRMRFFFYRMNPLWIPRWGVNLNGATNLDVWLPHFCCSARGHFSGFVRAVAKTRLS